MHKFGLIQTRSYSSNEEAIKDATRLLNNMGKKEVDIVCLPEQWLKDNTINNYGFIFKEMKKVAKQFSMTIITGAFYERRKEEMFITAPIIGPDGRIIGNQEKIHPFDYEKKIVKPGKEAKIFKTCCKFGVIVCYDMVFPKVSNLLVKKGAEVLFSPSRIVRRGIKPWHVYVQARALENRIPIIAANVANNKFGGESIMVNLQESNGVMIPKITLCQNKERTKVISINLKKFSKERKKRFSDLREFY